MNYCPIVTISKSRIKRIIVHGLRPEFGSFVIVVQGWPIQPTIEEFKYLLADQEVIDKQISGASVKNNEEEFFSNKKRYQFRQHKNEGSKGNVDKSKGHQ